MIPYSIENARAHDVTIAWLAIKLCIFIFKNLSAILYNTISCSLSRRLNDPNLLEKPGSRNNSTKKIGEFDSSVSCSGPFGCFFVDALAIYSNGVNSWDFWNLVYSNPLKDRSQFDSPNRVDITDGLKNIKR
jgi:hypothetical protein